MARIDTNNQGRCCHRWAQINAVKKALATSAFICDHRWLNSSSHSYSFVPFVASFSAPRCLCGEDFVLVQNLCRYLGTAKKVREDEARARRRICSTDAPEARCVAVAP